MIGRRSFPFGVCLFSSGMLVLGRGMLINRYINVYVAETFLYHLVGTCFTHIICLVLGCSIFGAVFWGEGVGFVRQPDTSYPYHPCMVY